MARKKLPKRFAPLLNSIFMSIIMSFTISLVLTFLHEGVGLKALADLPLTWLQSFLVAWPCALIFSPLVEHFVRRFVRH